MPKSLHGACDQFLVSKGKGPESKTGHYRRNAGREIERFIDWAAGRGVESFADIEGRGEKLFREYARHLARRQVTASTVQTYWNYLSAWTGWCVREGLLPANYAQRTAAKEPLPDVDGSDRSDTQTWSDAKRRALLEYVDDQARAAIDEHGTDALQPVRDRALAYTLSYTGIRGAELLRDPQDARRDGVAWRDVDLDHSQMTVLSKNQEWDARPVPESAHPAIERLRTVLDPPTGDWPVIPTLDTATLRRAARDQLGDVDADPLAGFADAVDILAVYRAHDLTPPALSTSGGRAVMQRLTDAAGIGVDRGEYLQPHGARRGAGLVLVQEHGVADAAKQLDNSARVVEEHYSDVLAKEQAERTGQAFENRE